MARSYVIVLVTLAIVALAIWLETVILRRRHLKVHGTSDAVVRCTQGHLFTTIWVPGVSFKAVRWGTRRYQHCPVGHHWSVVRLVDPAQLSDDERQRAALVHDIRIP